MSLKKVEQVRAEKGFKVWDLVVYAAVIILIVVLFVVFVFARDASPVDVITVSAGFAGEQRTVCTYTFATRSFVYDESAITVNSRTEDAIELTFHAENGGHNVILIDIANASVSVTSADCPSLDCVHTPAITSNSSLPIICSNHQMIVQTDYISGSVIQ